MVENIANSSYAAPSLASERERIRARISIVDLGMSLGLLFGITFGVCVAFDLLFPKWAMYEVWDRLLPGFTWLSWPSFFLGLAETIGFGWYIAVVFAPLYNFFAARRDRTSANH